jgi:hypothetical protein
VPDRALIAVDDLSANVKHRLQPLSFAYTSLCSWQVRATGKTYQTELGYIFFFEEDRIRKVYIYAKDAKGINEAFIKGNASGA